MNDLIKAIIVSASGYGAFLALGVGCLIWYNIWNRRKMEEEFSGFLENEESQEKSIVSSWLTPSSGLSFATSQEGRASSVPSLPESAINDVYQGRRQSTKSMLSTQTMSDDGDMGARGIYMHKELGQTMSTLVEDVDESKIGLAHGGDESTRNQRNRRSRSVDSRESWEL
ncbi:hypothetical protein N8I77_010616 [Diaporthe amygdali]|uniref:Uncharacterized protein n=1 Tax=Phomopsis amygdali TaxID=1214568 RepID=A0AAD9S8Q5_PHOAM|nr:hypothetical protein N8I77_010616 [Diaporthe amygdali]